MDMLLKKAGDLKRSVQRFCKDSAFYLRRKSRKLKRSLISKLGNKPGNGYAFAIVCVKRPEYVKMAIDNINSLHYLNAAHSFVIYADTVCRKEFSRLKGRLDYPKQVRCDDQFGAAIEPWQKYKVETIIDASKKGLIFTDADGIWHDEPVIDPRKITILVKANAIKENPAERQVAEKLFIEQRAVDFNHYVTGFLSIPPALMIDGLAADMKRFTSILLDDPLSFLSRKEDRNNIHRLAEELGVNIALQAHHKEIVTLKKDDGPKSRVLLQSLYYGCNNQIIK